MLKEYSSSASWNSAAIAGLVMAAVTIAIELLGALCAKVPGVAGGFLNFIAWAAKMVLCAFTFKFLLQRFHDNYEGVDYFALKKYGFKLALFSAIIVAAYSLVNLLVINPDAISDMMQSFREGYSSMMDSNSEAAFEKMLPKMPVYIGIVTVIYCYLWGTFYTGLFAKSIAPFDPFADIKDTPDNQ
jgi:hypothetical protein